MSRTLAGSVMGVAFPFHLTPSTASVMAGVFNTFWYHWLPEPVTASRYRVPPSWTNHTGRAIGRPDERPVTVSSISSASFSACRNSWGAMAVLRVCSAGSPTRWRPASTGAPSARVIPRDGGWSCEECRPAPVSHGPEMVLGDPAIWPGFSGTSFRDARIAVTGPATHPERRRKARLALRELVRRKSRRIVGRMPTKTADRPPSTAETAENTRRATHGVISASNGWGNQHVHQQGSARPLPHRQRLRPDAELQRFRARSQRADRRAELSREGRRSFGHSPGPAGRRAHVSPSPRSRVSVRTPRAFDRDRQAGAIEEGHQGLRDVARGRRRRVSLLVLCHLGRAQDGGRVRTRGHRSCRPHLRRGVRVR